MFIETLIGENTVNNVPPRTFDAYSDHGNPKLIFEKNARKANQILNRIPKFGIDINEITQQLEDEGIKKII